MYKTYRTTGDTIIAKETQSADTTLTLISDIDGKEYVMVKKQSGSSIYDLLLIGHVTEIVPDVYFKEFRDITYARLNKMKW